MKEAASADLHTHNQKDIEVSAIADAAGLRNNKFTYHSLITLFMTLLIFLSGGVLTALVASTNTVLVMMDTNCGCYY